MKSSNSQWKSQLGERVPDHLAAELDVFEHEIALKKQGKIEDRVFAETRLRRGAYGQRYDNGQRSDGKATRTLQLSVRQHQRAQYPVGRARHAAHQDSRSAA